MSRKRKSPAEVQVPRGVIPKESPQRGYSITDGRACQERRRRRTSIEKPSYWAVIPADIRYDQKLPPMARLLYAEISSLTNATGYCFASNEHFTQLFEESERTLQRHLKALEAGGYITVLDGDVGTGRRKIYAGVNPLAGNPDKNDGVPTNPDKNVGVTPTKMSGSTLKNKKSNTPPKAPQGAARENRKTPEWKPERFEKFWDYYPRLQDGSKPARARAVKAWDKLRPDDTTIDQMATALRRQKNSEQWQRGIGIPYASSWLNARRWEDDYQAPEDPADFFEDEEDLPEWT